MYRNGKRPVSALRLAVYHGSRWPKPRPLQFKAHIAAQCGKLGLAHP